MKPDHVESLLREYLQKESQGIEPPSMLEHDVVAGIETAGPTRAQPHGALPQVAWTAAMVALVIGIAGGAAWLRLHKSRAVAPPPVALTIAPSPREAPSPRTTPTSASPSPVISPSPRATARTSATESAQASATPAPTPFNPGYTVPDAASGSAVGFYAPGGYPILANQQTTGGQGFTTWKWNGSRWIVVLRAGSPAIASNMVYDPAIGMTVAMGGSSGFTGWNGSAWVPLPSLPGGIQGQAYLAFDQARNYLLLMDSSQAGATTWTYDGGAWKKVNTAAAPVRVFGGGFAYDPRNSTTILFGGGYMDQSFRDTWQWNGTAWVQLHPTTSPPAGNAVMGFDSATRQMILLVQNGTAWTWDGWNWTPLSGSSPPFGAYAGLVYDTAQQAMFLWEGGVGYEQGSQTWTYRAGQWTRRS
jgi:hypothetical protein